MCVITAMFSISCMLLVNWLAGVCMCVRAGKVVLRILFSSHSAAVRLQSIWCCWSVAERFEKSLRSPRKGKVGVQRDRRADEEDCKWGKEDYTPQRSGLSAAKPSSSWLVRLVPTNTEMIVFEWLYFHTIIHIRLFNSNIFSWDIIQSQLYYHLILFI